MFCVLDSETEANDNMMNVCCCRGLYSIKQIVKQINIKENIYHETFYPSCCISVKQKCIQNSLT